MFKLGLIVNPIAGMGGSVGLKGTDGTETLQKALQRGAVPSSPKRAAFVLEKLSSISDKFQLITCPGIMGEDLAKKCNIASEVLRMDVTDNTKPEHTRQAAGMLLQENLNLLLFVGGDGTARDLAAVVGEKKLCLGVPAGVKIHSSVFALSPSYAAEITADLIRGRKARSRLAEVMDIDEDAFRAGEVKARLFGYLLVPGVERGLQVLKAGSPASESVRQQAIASYFVEEMNDDYLYLVGPGTTTRELLRKIGYEGTLLGVDALRGDQLIGEDLNEKECLTIMESFLGSGIKIVVTPIGGQGFIFGRGNQQLSPKVISKVGREGILILSTPEKLQALQGRPFRLDTGDPILDAKITGFYRVFTGYRESTYYRVEN